ncbi:excalibur calcium-binding domain-containing protein [Saccharothrix texasensis]|uniref:Excalibur calcium-binding domain-containing protein n=1 Tax=Saccharothrix texasensis TaxID=103734 RepID=A0A3N1HAW5_9PSEU|nr:excalibur calcium-binding domain-containing protein [Saccharothrix texasensis]ROP39653.1 excalibur calcium-binding domain-containing protein [Saccharothrix texasensis]
MSSGRSVAFAGVALLLATGALVALALTVNEPRPVDARQVHLSPAEPGVLSATYTTTLEVARPTTIPAVVPPPEQRPVPPITTVTTVAVTTTSEPPPPPSSTTPPTSTTSTRPSWGDNCDYSYLTDGACVPWRFPRGVSKRCEWLYEQGIRRIEVVGWDRHRLDRDHDGIACERAD